MTIVSDLITQSLRESDIISIGANPTPAEADEALTRLNSLILSVVGNEIGYILEDWNITNTATASTGQVLFTGIPTAAQTLTIGDEVYTFRAARAVPFEVTIGIDATATGANLVTALGLDSDLVTGVNVTGTVTLTAQVPGTAGNAINLSETASNTTVSGPFMTGGVQTTVILKPSSFAQNSSGFTVQPQSRLICNLLAPTSFELDPQPQDGQRLSAIDASNNFSTRPLTLVGNGRLIDGATSVLLDDDLSRRQWVYRSDQSNWISIEPLDEDAEMPFPEEFDDYFIIMLAMRLNPRYGRALTAESAARLSQQREQLFYRYNQSRLRQAELPINRQAGFGFPPSGQQSGSQ